MSIKVFFEGFYLSCNSLAIFYFYTTKTEWEFDDWPYALNAQSPMVFKFISGSLSLSGSLEYLLLYCEYVCIDRGLFR